MAIAAWRRQMVVGLHGNFPLRLRVVGGNLLVDVIQAAWDLATAIRFSHKCRKVSRNVELQKGIPEAKVYAIYFWSQDSCFCSSMYKSIFKTRFLWEMDKTNNQLPLNIEYIRISTHQTSSPFNTWLALLVLFSGCKPGIWEARHPNTSWGLVVGPSKTYQTNTFVRHLDVEGKMCFQIPC